MSLNPYEPPPTLPSSEDSQLDTQTTPPPTSSARIAKVLLLTPVLAVGAGVASLVLVNVAAFVLTLDLVADRPSAAEIVFMLARVAVPVWTGLFVLEAVSERLAASLASRLLAAFLSFLLVIGLVWLFVMR